MQNQYYQNNAAPQQAPQAKKNRTIAPYIAIIISSVILAVSFFLPVVSVKSEYRFTDEALNAAEYFADELDLYYYDEAEDIADSFMNISIPNLKKLADLSIEEFEDIFDEEAVLGVYIIFFVVLLNTALILLFALLKKGTPTLIFCVLDFLTYCVVAVAAFIIATESHFFTTGIGLSLHIIANIVTFAFSIWLIASKSKAKKEMLAAQVPVNNQYGYPVQQNNQMYR